MSEVSKPFDPAELLPVDDPGSAYTRLKELHEHLDTQVGDDPQARAQVVDRGLLALTAEFDRISRLPDAERANALEGQTTAFRVSYEADRARANQPSAGYGQFRGAGSLTGSVTRPAEPNEDGGRFSPSSHPRGAGSPPPRRHSPAKAVRPAVFADFSNNNEQLPKVAKPSAPAASSGVRSYRAEATESSKGPVGGLQPEEQSIKPSQTQAKTASGTSAEADILPKTISREAYKQLLALPAGEQPAFARKIAAQLGVEPTVVLGRYAHYLDRELSAREKALEVRGPDTGEYQPSEAMTYGEMHDEFERISGLEGKERDKALAALPGTFEREAFEDWEKDKYEAALNAANAALARGGEDRERSRLPRKKIAVAVGGIAVGAVLVGTYFAMKHGGDASAVHHAVSMVKYHGIKDGAHGVTQSGHAAITHGAASVGPKIGHVPFHHLAAPEVPKISVRESLPALHPELPPTHFDVSALTNNHTVAQEAMHLPGGFGQAERLAQSAINNHDLKQVTDPKNPNHFFWQLTAKGAAKIGARPGSSNTASVMKLLATYSNGSVTVS